MTLRHLDDRYVPAAARLLRAAMRGDPEPYAVGVLVVVALLGGFAALLAR